MFELVEVAANGQFYDPLSRLEYIAHWETKLEKLDTAMKKVSQDNLQGIREEIDSYRRIRTAIAQLTDTLKNMNTLTPEIHSESDFAALIAAITQRLGTSIEINIPVNR